MSDTEVLTPRSPGNSNQVTRCRSHGFTITAWTDEYLEKLKKSNPQYMCWGPETCPDTGRFHWQVYIHYANARYLSSMGKEAGPDGRVFKSDGSAEDNRYYVFGPYNKKGKTKPINPEAKEIGVFPIQGRRNDIESFRDDIMAGKRKRHLSRDYATVRAKYPKFEEVLIREELEETAYQQYENNIKPEIHVLWGPPGTGKTKYVFEKHNCRDIFEPDLRKCGTHWWTAYDGQDVILLDEFTGQLPIRDFLRLIDRYPYRMETKGGHTWRTATKIYICSNESPSDWYPAEAHQFAKIQRRLDTVTYVESDASVRSGGGPTPPPLP